MEEQAETSSPSKEPVNTSIAPESAQENLDSYYDPKPAQPIPKQDQEPREARKLPEWKINAGKNLDLLRTDPDAAFRHMRAYAEELRRRKALPPSARQSGQNDGTRTGTAVSTKQEIPAPNTPTETSPAPSADYTMPPVPTGEWTGATLSQAARFPLNETQATTPATSTPNITSANYHQEQLRKLKESGLGIQKTLETPNKALQPTSPEKKDPAPEDETAELAELEDALLGAEIPPLGLQFINDDLDIFLKKLYEEEWLDSLRPLPTTPPREEDLEEEMDTPINPYGALEERKDKAVQEPTPETAPTEAVENMEPAQVLTGTPTDEAINSANLEIPVIEPAPPPAEAPTTQVPVPSQQPRGNWFTRLLRRKPPTQPAIIEQTQNEVTLEQQPQAPSEVDLRQPEPVKPELPPSTPEEDTFWTSLSPEELDRLPEREHIKTESAIQLVKIRREIQSENFDASQIGRDYSLLIQRDKTIVPFVIDELQDLTKKYQDKNLFYALGYALDQAGRYEESQAALKQAQAMDPTAPRI